MPKPRSVSVNNTHPALKLKQSEVKALYRFLDIAAAPDAIPAGELSIAFVDAQGIIQMHEQFLADPTITDVITFPGDEEDDFAGEICVCTDFAAQQAPLFGQSFAEELCLYLVHGWLHLAGYDDIDDDDRAEMRKAEARTMALVREAGLVPKFELRA
ncbi:MAG: rRNA maturation RNase YbeY [Opitutales bacterium]|nr:rRNA maturation RNase YbeY [Opitutales bacterium]